MPKKEQITHKVGKIRKYLKLLKQFQGLDLSILENDLNTKASAERFLYLALDSLISFLEMFISLKNYRKAGNYAENIEILLEEKKISLEQADFLHKAVGLRNILSHDYERLDMKIIKEVIDDKLVEIENFIKYLEEII